MFVIKDALTSTYVHTINFEDFPKYAIWKKKQYFSLRFLCSTFLERDLNRSPWPASVILIGFGFGYEIMLVY